MSGLDEFAPRPSAADELRAAATKLSTLAQSASPGPWTHTDVHVVDMPSASMSFVVCHSDDGSSPANAAYVAAMDPAVALALAQWLDASAEVCDDGNDPDLGATAVARAINGGTPCP